LWFGNLSLTLREEHRLRVFENRVLRGKEGEMGGKNSTHGRDRNAYKILVGKPEGEASRGRRRCRWEDNIKMDLGEIG